MLKPKTLISAFYIWLCWLGAIFILISWPFPEYVGTKITLYDKVFHAILFGGMSYWTFYLLRFWPRIKKSWQAAVLSLVFSIAYSAFCEYWQEIIPGRTLSIYDFYAGVAGAVLICLLLYVRERKT